MDSFYFNSFTGLVKEKCSYQKTFKNQLLWYWCQFPSFDTELGLYKEVTFIAEGSWMKGTCDSLYYFCNFL